MEPRFEFTISYYIFGWFLLYYFGFVTYNPYIWLVIALLSNIIGEIYLIFIAKKPKSFNDYVIYIIVDIIIKIIPIWLLRNSIIKWADFMAGIYLCILVLLWMYIRLGSIQKIIQYFHDIQSRLVEKKASTPLINYLHKWKIL